MISIAGGAYREYCSLSDWDYLYGSGLRAAFAISGFTENVHLSTYIGAQEEELLKHNAQQYEISVGYKRIDSTVYFEYFHGLDAPVIYPQRHKIKSNSPHKIESDIILRFGFMEGDAIVHGKKVVYDPQSAFCPEPFHENGSTAENLAIVANLKEVSLLTGENEIDSIIKQLQEEHSADVIVIKRGSFGCDVIVGNDKKHIPAYKTKTVWPIGTGDVFAAIFAYYWGCEDISAFEAADNASKAVAYYCSTKMLPKPSTGFLSSQDYKPVHSSSDPKIENRTVYLASPFFNIGQRWVVEKLRKYLQQHGLNVFSPLHDVGKGPGIDVAPADLEGLDKSDLVFAIVDGLDPGTIFEIGYARSKNIPVIALVENEKEEDLKMIEGSGCEIFSDFVSAIYNTVWKALSL